MLLPDEENVCVGFSLINEEGRGGSQVKVVLEGGQSDVPWWFGLGWVGWKSGCDPLKLFKSAVCVLYDFWGGGGNLGGK